jgi:ABC-type glycerol-3-phosphate transport system substrate-binding protein
VRKALVLPLLLLALGLAACGGGGSSSSGGTTASAADGAEARWGKEVEGVMRDFENNVSAKATEQIHTTSAQYLLEPVYRAYGAALTKLGKELEATAAPSACVALRKRMGADAHALGQLTSKLGHEGEVNQEEFSALVFQQEAKMHRYGHDLTEITYRPHC